MNTVLGIINESFLLLNKMSVYLLFGFLFAGILHIFLKEGTIAKHLGKDDFFSVVKASLFGIPLPLCSCGVIPAALSLRKQGASKGSVMSFLISTPTTGIDSIFATYSLLGGVFTIYRIGAAFITAIFSGVAANIFLSKEIKQEASESKCASKSCCSHNHDDKSLSFFDNVKGVFKYAFGDLLKDAGAWLILGIFIGGAISYFVPESFVERYMGSTWLSMIIMLIIGIPMYVCATGSIPIAAALMLKGLNPGAAFVFLMVGPATNSTALTVIIKELGFKAAVIFLSSIVVSSLSMGALLNYVYQYVNIDITTHLLKHSELLPVEVEIIASVFLIALIAFNLIPRRVVAH